MNDLGPELPVSPVERAAANGAPPMGVPDRRPEFTPDVRTEPRVDPGHHAAFGSGPVDRTRGGEHPAGRGQTQIADVVVEKVAAIAAREVDGIYDLGADPSRAFHGVRDRGLAEGAGRGVSVEIEGRHAQVDLTVVVRYGYPVLAVCDAVRGNVIDAVERMLGLEVVEVNIMVDDVQLEDDEHR